MEQVEEVQVLKEVQVLEEEVQVLEEEEVEEVQDACSTWPRSLGGSSSWAVLLVVIPSIAVEALWRVTSTAQKIPLPVLDGIYTSHRL